MKTVELKQLSLRNFKGTPSLEINFNGSLSIYGANESGKSTINTAFTWLLTGKDEFDRADYKIKNTNRKELNSQAHEVEAILIVDGREVKLKRVYLEDWQKPKGQSTKVFKGNYTDYYYNDVTCSATEYQAKVDAIIPAKLIKLVTNPTFFNSLKWDDQRRNLIGIAGDITDDEIFSSFAMSDKDFSTLRLVLAAGKTAEELKKELSAKKLILKKAAAEFLPRIDEAKRNRPETEDWEALAASILAKEGEISLIDAQLDNASMALSQKQSGIMAKQREVHGKESALAGLRNKIKTELLAKQNDGTGQIEAVKQQLRTANQRILDLQKIDADNAKNKRAYEDQIAAKDALVSSCRDKWKAINAETFTFDEAACTCPTCKQALPGENIEEQKATLLKNFNDSVTRRKADVVAESDQYKKEIIQLQDRISSIDATDNTNAISAAMAEVQSLNTKLSSLQLVESKKQVDDIELAVDGLMKLNGDALNLQDEIKALNEAIKAETEALGTNNGNEQIKERKAQLQSQVNDLRKKLGVKLTIENTDKRILQLETEERANAQAIADLEQQEFDVEKYTRAKMDILEQKVNQMFKYVKFRLFETQVNGGIAETCVCEYQGVPYPTLNTAAKVLAGLDVLDTFSKHYKITAPVFIDNRESTSWIPEISSPVISLFVSPADKKLRIEPSVKAKAKKDVVEFA